MFKRIYVENFDQILEKILEFAAILDLDKKVCHFGDHCSKKDFIAIF